MSEPLSLKAVHEKLDQEFSQRRNAIKQVAMSVQSALNRYEREAEKAVLNEFLRTNGIPCDADDVESAALDLWMAVEAVPEIGAVVPAADDVPPEVAVLPDDEPPLYQGSGAPFPSLSGDALQRPMLVVGGQGSDGAAQWIHDKGVKAVWVTTNVGAGGDRAVQSACEGVRKGSHCYVVVLNELISHPQYHALRAAAKASGTPLVCGKKGGRGILSFLFEQYERRSTKD